MILHTALRVDPARQRRRNLTYRADDLDLGCGCSISRTYFDFERGVLSTSTGLVRTRCSGSHSSREGSTQEHIPEDLDQRIFSHVVYNSHPHSGQG